MSASCRNRGTWIRRDLEFANASLLIVRGKDGQIRAFYNVCTHRGTQLVEKRAARAQLPVPLSHVELGDDGRLVAAPDFERFSLTKEECALPKVRSMSAPADLRQSRSRSGAGPPRISWRLCRRAGNLPVAKATTFHEYVYEIDANWKITYDNFQENYHLRFVHGLTGAATVHATTTSVIR